MRNVTKGKELQKVRCISPELKKSKSNRVVVESVRKGIARVMNTTTAEKTKVAVATLQGGDYRNA